MGSNRICCINVSKEKEIMADTQLGALTGLLILIGIVIFLFSASISLPWYAWILVILAFIWAFGGKRRR